MASGRNEWHLGMFSPLEAAPEQLGPETQHNIDRSFAKVLSMMSSRSVCDSNEHSLARQVPAPLPLRETPDFPVAKSDNFALFRLRRRIFCSQSFNVIDISILRYFAQKWACGAGQKVTFPMLVVGDH